MPRKPKKEPERKVVEDFSQAIKMDKHTMARLVEFVLKGKFKGYSVEAVFGLSVLLALLLIAYHYFFR